MPGYLSLILHAHLPFVRHPEHERFLEENWLFEACTETYLPLLLNLERWREEQLDFRLAFTLSPTLCSMLRDPLLQHRYHRYLAERLELAEKEVHRTCFEKPYHDLALFYLERFQALRAGYEKLGQDLVGAFRGFQDSGHVELITTAATHAVLPLLAGHAPSVRAQVLVARDHYRSCFGRDPRGFWLPECGYEEVVEPALRETNLRWFVLDSHGLLHASPQPRHGVSAPLFTPAGIAAFGRDSDSARQVWSRQQGYPADPRYRDFYRDIGFDLDLDYVKPCLASPNRGFTGIKYHRITSPAPEKSIYDRRLALQAAAEHAAHFVSARISQLQRLGDGLDRPPLFVCPYDAELFGHWWFEGPEFLDCLVRRLSSSESELKLLTPGEYLGRHQTNQVATPSPSSWGQEGYWQVWLNEANQWIYPHLREAQERMTELAQRFPDASGVQLRALKQAGRELLLAQASDWPFILSSGTSPDYAGKRIKEHLLRFTSLHSQLLSGQLDEPHLRQLEDQDNLFPELDYRYWAWPAPPPERPPGKTANN